MDKFEKGVVAWFVIACVFGCFIGYVLRTFVGG